MYWLPLWAKMLCTISVPPRINERQWSVNDCSSDIMDTQSTVHRREPMMNVSAASMGENAIDDIATIF